MLKICLKIGINRSMHIDRLLKWNWLAPFQGGLYYGYHLMESYLLATGDMLCFKADDEQAYHQNIREGMNTGVLQLIPGDFSLLRVHPLWQIEIKGAMDEPALEKMQAVYHTHVRNMAEILAGLVVSGVSDRVEEALAVISIEWPNLRRVLRESARRGEPTEALSVALRHFYKTQSRMERWLPEALFLLDLTAGYSDNRAARIGALDDVATTLLDLFRPVEARPYLEEAWALCQLAKNRTEEDVIHFCALCDSMSRCATEFSEQRDWLGKAVDMAKNAGLTRLWVRISYNLSELLIENGKEQESRAILESLLPIVNNGVGRDMSVHIALSLALHAQRAGQFREARRYFREALRHKPHDALTAEIRQDLASAYIEEGKIRQAKRQLVLAIPVFIRTGNHKQMGNAYNLMSVIALDEGAPYEGLEYAFKALECFAETGQWGLMGQVYYNLALWCYKQEWWRDCIRYSQKAEEQYEKAGNRLQVARQQLLRAVALTGMGRLHAARKCINFAKSVLADLDDSTELANIQVIEEGLMQAGYEKRSTKQRAGITGK